MNRGLMMLKFEVDINPNLAGDLATRIMAIWPGIEIRPEDEVVAFCLNLDNHLDNNLRLFDQALQNLEKARALEPLTVRCQNLVGPDSRPESLRLGSFIVQHPDMAAKTEPEKKILKLDSGTAFGSGAHPSTALVLNALEEYYRPLPGLPDRSNHRVLDVGTGSGILALAAARLGHGPILAVDPSEEAIRIARRNAELNNLASRLELRHIPVNRLEGEFDVILANLVPSVLLRAARKLDSLLALEGTLIVSGFADTQSPQVLKVMTKLGLVTRKSYSRAGWSALALIKTDQG